MYWIDCHLNGKVARFHGTIQEGLPRTPDITYQVCRGVIVVVPDSDDEVTVYSGGDTRKRNPVELYLDPTDAENDAWEQLVRRMTVVQVENEFSTGRSQLKPPATVTCTKSPNGEHKMLEDMDTETMERFRVCNYCGTKEGDLPFREYMLGKKPGV